jgi:cytochrome c oxidase subunit III
MKNSCAILPRQFDDLEQHRETVALGMWVFLGTELMFFGGVFLAFTIYRITYTSAFAEAANHLNLLSGSINSLVLLTSSFLFSVAISAFEARRRLLTLFLLGSVIFLGLAFLVIKGFEYHEEWTHGFFPGAAFSYSGTARDSIQLFFVLYFIATGLHALHLMIGIFLTLLLILTILLNWFNRGRQIAIGVFGLYWHFVDFIWLFIFPLFYLLRVR